MAFKIKRTTAEWGVINIREEGRGQGDKVEAHDIPFVISGGPELLDQVITYDKTGEILSEHLFDAEDGRVLIPGAELLAKHKQEGLTITVWDQKKPIVLKEAKIQEPKIKLYSPNQVTLASKIQIAEPSDELVNRFRHLRGEVADLEIVSDQSDMFDDDD